MDEVMTMLPTERERGYIQAIRDVITLVEARLDPLMADDLVQEIRNMEYPGPPDGVIYARAHIAKDLP